MQERITEITFRRKILIQIHVSLLYMISFHFSNFQVNVKLSSVQRLSNSIFFKNLFVYLNEIPVAVDLICNFVSSEKKETSPKTKKVTSSFTFGTLIPPTKLAQNKNQLIFGIYKVLKTFKQTEVWLIQWTN